MRSHQCREKYQESLLEYLAAYKKEEESNKWVMDGRLVHSSAVAEIRLARGAAIIQLTTDRLAGAITNQQVTGIPGRLAIENVDASKLRKAITEAQCFAKIDKEFEDLVNRTISMATYI